MLFDPPSDGAQTYGPIPVGVADQVTEPPAVMVDGDTVQLLTPVVPVVTVIGVHAPQLSFSSASVIAPTNDALLSAQARTYQVPAVPKV